MFSEGVLTFINCYDVKSTTKMQNIFMFTKIAALVIVIVIGVTWMGMGIFILNKLIYFLIKYIIFFLLK